MSLMITLATVALGMYIAIQSFKILGYFFGVIAGTKLMLDIKKKETKTIENK